MMSYLLIDPNEIVQIIISTYVNALLSQFIEATFITTTYLVQYLI